MKAGTRLKVDPDTLATDLPGVFAGGDVGSINPIHCPGDRFRQEGCHQYRHIPDRR